MRQGNDWMVNGKKCVYRNVGCKKTSGETNRTVGMLLIIIMMVKADRHKGNQTDNDDKERRFLMM
jgi:hypothetical protein